MINISTGVISDIVTAVSTAFGELAPLLAVIFGIIIAFFAGRKIINIFKTVIRN